MKERGSEGAKKRVCRGEQEKKDNFLALLLNKSVSIATIQPERERGESGGAPQRRKEGESYHSNGGRG